MDRAAPHETRVLRDAYRRETARLLKRRIDLAAGLFVAFVGLALLVDVVVHPERGVVGLPIYGAEVVVCVLALAATRLPWARLHVGPLTAAMGSALGLLMNLYFSSVSLAPEIQALGLVCLMTAFAVLIPLGAVAQAALAGATLLGFFVASYPTIDPEQAAYCWVGLVAGATTSVFGATFLDRYRYEAFARATLLEEVSARSQQEAQVSSALAHVGATLHANMGRAHVFETVNRMSRELLGCDWSSTFILDQAARGYRLEAAVGVTASVETELRRAVLSPERLPLFRAFEAGQLIEICDANDQTWIPPGVMERFETSSALYVPLFRDDTVIGVLVNGFRERTGPFTATQRKVALGIGNATAIALENERLLGDLETASRLKSEFVSTMSHELRTPLNVIAGYTEILSDPETGQLSEDQFDLVRRIHRNAASLLELIESTLHLGRLEAGRDTLHPEWVDLATLFEQLGQENEEAARIGRVQLEFQRSGRARDPVRVDRGKVKLILQNLIGNALKFSAGGRVDVSASESDGRLVLEVRDTGVGIPKEKVAHIFGMFQQLDASAPGVGLGLHIVKRVSERLAGRVVVESREGEGTRFRVSLPADFVATTLARAG